MRSGERLANLDFADYLVLIADVERLQILSDRLYEVAKKLGLGINSEKTKQMNVRPQKPMQIKHERSTH